MWCNPYLLLAILSSTVIIAIISSVQVVNLLVETKGGAVGVSMVGLSDRMIKDTMASQWRVVTPGDLQHPVPFYDNYNIPPLPKHMADLMPSSRWGMACCANRHRTEVTCFGGVGIAVNKEAQLTKADRIRSNDSPLYSRDQVLSEYWQWSNLGHRWKRLSPESIAGNLTRPGTYHGGCWTDQQDSIWFGGGLVVAQTNVVASEHSFHRHIKMPRLARFAYWTDHRRGFMYLFGGLDSLGRYSNELMRIPNSLVNGSEWQLVTASSNNDGKQIAPRVGATVVQHENTIYVFGGESRVTPCFGDLWQFNDRRWTLLYEHQDSRLTPNHRASPQHPGCRKYATGQLPSVSNSLFKFRGGQTNGNVTMMDTWSYSLTRSKWVWSEGSHHGDVVPFEDPLTKATPVLPSMYHTAHWTDHLDREYYFGGCTDGGQCSVVHNWVWMK